MPSFPIQLKRNGTAAATPSSLLHGEVALNYADGKLFWKDASNVIQSFTFQAYALSSHTHAASDITSGTFDAARIANDSITYAKIQNVSATDRLLGRSSAGAGDVEEITCTAFGRSLIDDADAAAARTTLSVQPTASPAFTGAATFDNTGNVVPLTVTNTGTANSFVVNDASGDTTPFVIDASGNVVCGSSTAKARLQTSGASAASPSLGSVTGSFLVTNSDTGYGMHFGVESSGVGWIQQGRTDGTATAYNLQLQPAGGQVLVPAGSASACGVAFSGDGNTGLFSPSADVVALATNGSERLSVGSSNRCFISGNNEQYALGVRYISTGGSVYFGATSNSATPDAAISNAGGGTLMTFANDGKISAGGIYTNTVGATNRDVFVDNTGLIGYVSSIRESKTDIVTLDDVSWLSALSPVSYRYRKRNADGTYSDEADGVTDYGLIAEDVEAVRPELCFYDQVDGEQQLRGVTYSKLITPMLRYIQQLEQRIAALEERLNHA